ncbi:MAG TPA: flavin reductase family protein [Acidimicrobiia bacterium]|nr:flavin reductase family protein [Acidimicrobiia bacterium]
MPEKRVIDPTAVEATDAYKLLIGLVVPRPIGWIGTVDAEGARNLAPFSFFNAVAATPPTVMFSPLTSQGAEKDTLRNVKATGEFTVNMVSDDLAEAMNATSGRYPPEVDEFALAGLTAVEGVVVAAPMVAEARANLECRVTRLVPVGRPPMDATLVIGEVVAFHVREDLLDGTRVDQAGLDLIGRMGGPNYTRTRDTFGMERPG